MLGGNPIAANPAATNLLYAGEQWDNDAQNYYLRARYYNPLNGLFNRTDPFNGNLQDPLSLHKYLYCHANPINNIDQSGKFVQALTTNMIIAIAIASIAPAILSAYDAAKAGASWLEIGLNAALTWAVSFGIGIGLALIAPLLISLATGIAGLFGISAIAAKVGLLILFASLTVYNMYEFWRTPQYPLSVKIAFTITLAVAIAVAIGKDGLTKIASKSKQFVKGLFSKQNTNSNPVISKAERLRLNRLKGNSYRDEIGHLMKKEGYDIKFERRYETSFGRRIIDIEVSKNGKILGGIETKTGSSPYTPKQQLKDAWLYRMKGYIVTVVHDM